MVYSNFFDIWDSFRQYLGLSSYKQTLKQEYYTFANSVYLLKQKKDPTINDILSYRINNINTLKKYLALQPVERDLYTLVVDILSRNFCAYPDDKRINALIDKYDDSTSDKNLFLYNLDNSPAFLYTVLSTSSVEVAKRLYEYRFEKNPRSFLSYNCMFDLIKYLQSNHNPKYQSLQINLLDNVIRAILAKNYCSINELFAEWIFKTISEERLNCLSQNLGEWQESFANVQSKIDAKANLILEQCLPNKVLSESLDFTDIANCYFDRLVLNKIYEKAKEKAKKDNATIPHELALLLVKSKFKKAGNNNYEPKIFLNVMEEHEDKSREGKILQEQLLYICKNYNSLKNQYAFTYTNFSKCLRLFYSYYLSPKLFSTQLEFLEKLVRSAPVELLVETDFLDNLNEVASSANIDKVVLKEREKIVAAIRYSMRDKNNYLTRTRNLLRGAKLTNFSSFYGKDFKEFDDFFTFLIQKLSNLEFIKLISVTTGNKNFYSKILSLLCVQRTETELVEKFNSLFACYQQHKISENLSCEFLPTLLSALKHLQAQKTKGTTYKSLIQMVKKEIPYDSEETLENYIARINNILSNQQYNLHTKVRVINEISSSCKFLDNNPCSTLIKLFQNTPEDLYLELFAILSHSIIYQGFSEDNLDSWLKANEKQERLGELKKIIATVRQQMSGKHYNSGQLLTSDPKQLPEMLIHIHAKKTIKTINEINAKLEVQYPEDKEDSAWNKSCLIAPITLGGSYVWWQQQQAKKGTPHTTWQQYREQFKQQRQQLMAVTMPKPKLKPTMLNSVNSLKLSLSGNLSSSLRYLPRKFIKL